MRTRVAFAAMIFAGLTHRFVAGCIDGFFALIAFIALGEALREMLTWPPNLIVALCVVLPVWFGLLPATKMQGTPGKRLTGIKVAGMNGERVGLGRSLLRFVLWLLTLGTLGLGLLLAAWSPKRQALHDFGARTLVVDAKATPAEIAVAIAPPMWWFNRVLGAAFLASVLMVLYAQVSVYMSMRKRTEISIAIFAVQPFQREVEKAMLEGKPIPAPPSSPDRRIRALTVQPNGKVVLDLAEDLNPGGRLYFTPTRTTKGIEWKCTSENLRKVHMGALCRE